MPESVKDRCTKAHEYIFLLSKSQKYYFDSDAIRNPPSPALIKQVEEGYRGEDTKDFAAGNAQSGSGTKARIIEGARKKVEKVRGHGRVHEGFRDKWDGLTKEEQQALGSNRRSVWNVATKPYKGAHFATFPPELIEPCVLAGSRVGDVVLDPFGGSGTTGMVAHRHGRLAVLCELNPDYLPLIHDRLASA
jgi:site-specific DNA-methyltransferase (cytosine-N4-specific)